MIPLISEHDTWISVDPVVGCPAQCRYCFLSKHSLTGVAPVVRATPAQTIEALSRYIESEPPGVRRPGLPTIVCIGNNTDLFMSKVNREFAVDFLRNLHDRLPSVVLVFVTKARLDTDTVASLDEVGHRCVVFLSQSFFRWYRTGVDAVERGVSRPEETAHSAALLRRTKNLIPVHFWRPITAINLPSSEEAGKQVRLARDAGFVASVAVGLKHGPYLREQFTQGAADASLAIVVPDSPKQQWSLGHLDESFADGLRRRALDAGAAYGYPVYLNSSCAVAFALEKPEFLGTFHNPMRASRCEPAVCPDAQRARCASAASREQPSVDKQLRSIARSLVVPEEALDWNSSECAISIGARLDQDSQCRLHHLTGFYIRPAVLSRTREWIGAAPQGSSCVDPHLELVDEGDLPFRMEVARLRRITGLVSPLCKPDEHRGEIFSRYHHVRRVASVAAIVGAAVSSSNTERCSGSLPLKLNEGHHCRAIDRCRVQRLAWAHDLNRWPFAHNVEWPLFDQSADVARFFGMRQAGLSTTEIADLIQLHRRDSVGMSLEGQIVLAADQATGLIEDTLLCITALGFSPTQVPLPVQEFLAMPLGEPWFQQRLWRLREEFMDPASIDHFAVRLDTTVTAYSATLVQRYLTHESSALLIASSFRDAVANLKVHFLQKLLFPLANEKVGRGHCHRERIFLPLVHLMGTDLLDRLTDMTDDDMLKLALDQNVIRSDELDAVYPDLDYIEHHEPHLLFRPPNG